MPDIFFSNNDLIVFQMMNLNINQVGRIVKLKRSNFENSVQQMNKEQMIMKCLN